MHQELNKIKEEKVMEESNIFNKYDYNKILNSFIKYFKENYKSIISDLFYGIECGMFKCCSCNMTTYNIQCFNLLLFPLEKVRECFGLQPGNPVTISQCFMHYENQILFNGENKIYCNNCNKMCDAINTTKLVSGPNILIIILNRGKGLEFDVKVNFELQLNITNFVINNARSINYELINIVTHLGESGMGGHFVSYCKSFVDGKWYLFNDSIVSLITDVKELYRGTIIKRKTI